MHLGQMLRRRADASASAARRRNRTCRHLRARARQDAVVRQIRQLEMIFMMMLSRAASRSRRIAQPASAICRLRWRCSLPATPRAQSAVQGVPNAMQGFSQNRDQPIQIEAASLEMRDKKKEATFSGNVKVVQGDTTMTSKTLVVFYEFDSARRRAAAPARHRLRRQCEGRPPPSGADPVRDPRSRRQLRRSSGWRPGATWS